MTTNVIYFNNDTGNFCNFELQTLKPVEHYQASSSSLNDMAELYIQDVIQEISRYGKDLEFPVDLLETLSDADINMLLLVSYDKRLKKSLFERLFMPLPCTITQLYKDIQNNDLLKLEAIGKYSVITSKDKDDDIVAVNIGFEELDSRFIKYQGI